MMFDSSAVQSYDRKSSFPAFAVLEWLSSHPTLIASKSIPWPRPLKCSLCGTQGIAGMSRVQALEPRTGCELLTRQNKTQFRFGARYGWKPAMSPAPAVIYDTSSNMKHLGREIDKVPLRMLMQQDGRERQSIWKLPKSYKFISALKRQTNK